MVGMGHDEGNTGGRVMNTFVARMYDFIVKVIERDMDIDDFLMGLAYNLDGNPFDSENVYLPRDLWAMGARIIDDYQRLQGEEE